MQQAIDIASLSNDDLPIGAVIVKEDKIIAKAHNQKEANNSVILHAEIVAIQQAEKILKNWRLDNCEMYVTLEPCPMCAWAILQARMAKVYFGASDTIYGAFGGALDLRQLTNSKTIVNGGIKEDECSKLIKNYMNKMRKQKADERHS